MSADSNKPWLASYEPGTPEAIGPLPFDTLPALLESAVQEFPDSVAYLNFGVAMSYTEFLQKVRAFAGYLQSRCQIKPGDRVAVMLPNLLQQPVCVHGALYAGAVVVNVNPLYTAPELRNQLIDCGAQVLVCLDTVQQVVADATRDLENLHVISSSVGDLLGPVRGRITNIVAWYRNRHQTSGSLEPDARLPECLDCEPLSTPVAQQAGDIAFLQYTGGTTGVAKAAMLSHANILSNVEQCLAWLGDDFEPGAETIVTALPLYHVFAMTANGITSLRRGARNILVTDPREINSLIRTIKRNHCTSITGVNTLFNAMLHARGFSELDFSTMKIALAGGMAVQAHVAQQWQEVTGIPLVEAYGLTETSPAVCMNPPHLKQFNGKIGLPLPSTEVLIRCDDGSTAQTGEAGELCVRGPQVMFGYWQRPDETAKVIDEEGWLHTGDIAVMDAAGFLAIVDRKKDMIDVSGFNVYPNEVEAVAASHPGILEAAAVGVADTRSGEAVKLFVVLKDPELERDEIIEHCRKSLTAYKVPKHIEFRESLPKTAVGKILRRALS